jgi:P27 family predicted phage terminase small subunit
MMQGRKPTPTALKLLTGNPGKRPIKFDQFAPEARIPRCPAELKGEARKEWKRVTTELHRYGMISEVDRGLLAMLCTTWARWIEAEAMIAKAAAAGGSGLFVKTPNGFPVQSPWVAVSNKAIDTYKSLCAEFGLSPAARTRVSPQTRQISLPGLEVVGGTEHEKPTLGSLMK